MWETTSPRAQVHQNWRRFRTLIIVSAISLSLGMLVIAAWLIGYDGGVTSIQIRGGGLDATLSHPLAVEPSTPMGSRSGNIGINKMTSEKKTRKDNPQQRQEEEDDEDDTNTVLLPQLPGTGMHSELQGTAAAGGLRHAKSFSEWNEPYHRRRQQLRQFQENTKSSPARPLRAHTFFTIDCTYHSLWQVLTLEMTWEEVRQGGYISRIISGCENAPDEKRMHWQHTILGVSSSAIKEEEGQKRHVDHDDTEKGSSKKKSSLIAPRSGSFFAPTFSQLPNGEYYAPYNRPNAIWYWLNHTDLTESVFLLLDPDMVFKNKLFFANVQQGKPAAQYYSYMDGYPFERFKCAKCPDSSYYQGNLSTRKQNFAVGPPWLIHLADLKSVMSTWVTLVWMLKQLDPSAWIIEMVAYSVAMAYHNLPHEFIHYGMVDSTDQPLVWDASSDKLIDRRLSHPLALLHYCYTFEVGETPPKDQRSAQVQHDRIRSQETKQRSPVINYFHWSKYRVPTDWPGGTGRSPNNFVDQCDCPLLQEFHTFPALPWKKRESHKWRRQTEMLEVIIPKINLAMTKWKINVLNCSKEQLKLGLSRRIRTSHIAYWVSEYEIMAAKEDGKSVEFHKVH